MSYKPDPDKKCFICGITGHEIWKREPIFEEMQDVPINDDLGALRPVCVGCRSKYGGSYEDYGDRERRERLNKVIQSIIDDEDILYSI